MAFDVALTTITFTGSSTADVESSDLGFTPKALLFLGTRATGTGSFTNEQGLAFGAATGVGQIASAGVGVSDARTSDERPACDVRSDACYHTIAGTSLALAGRCSLKSFTRSVSGTGQGFTLQIDAAFPSSFVVDVLAIGGSHIENAFAGTMQLSSGAGNKSTTSPGFQGNCLIMFGAGNRTSTINSVATSYGNLTFGVATSSSARWCLAQGAVNGTTTDHSGIVSTNALARLIGSTTLLEATVDFVSHDANGFTVSLAGADTARTPQMGYLYLKLTTAPEVGSFTTQTSTGQFDGATGLTSQPAALLAMCRPEATATETALATGADAGEWAIGVATASTKVALWWEPYEVGAISAGNATETYARRVTDKFLINYDRTAANTLSAIGELDFVSFTPSSGTGFRLDQTDADAQASLVPFLAFPAAAAPATSTYDYNFPRGVMRGVLTGTVA